MKLSALWYVQDKSQFFMKGHYMHQSKPVVISILFLIQIFYLHKPGLHYLVGQHSVVQLVLYEAECDLLPLVLI